MTELDTRALEFSKEALTKIDMHAESCDKRYEEISKGQKAIFRLINQATARVIMMLLGLSGFLIIKVMGWL